MPTATPTNKTVYFIGDIHGCLDELLELEAKIMEHARGKGWQPLIVSVGDLIDRGPKVAQVVEHFRQGVLQGTHWAIMGNHEAELLRNIEAFRPELFKEKSLHFPSYIATMEDEYRANLRGSDLYPDLNTYQEVMHSSWLEQGGSETLLSYGCNDLESFDIPAVTLQFVANLPIYYENEEAIATHALARSEEYQDTKDLLIRTLNPTDRDRLKHAASSLIWNRTAPIERLDQKRFHVSGHTPVEEPRIDKDLGFVQIDTGCVYGDRLCSYCVRSQDFIFVKSRFTWNEDG